MQRLGETTDILWATTKDVRVSEMCRVVPHIKELFHTRHTFQMFSGNVTARGTLPQAQSELENHKGLVGETEISRIYKYGEGDWTELSQTFYPEPLSYDAATYRNLTT